MMRYAGKPFSGDSGIYGTFVFAFLLSFLLDISPVFSQSSSPVLFQSFDLGELRGRVAHEAFSPLSGKPITGATHVAVATLTGPFATAEFRLVSLTGNVIRPLTLPAPSISGVSSGFGEFTGAIIIPNQPFQVAVKGLDAQNAPYDILHPKVFSPQTIEVNFDRTQVTKVGNTSTLYADVTNHGENDTFVIEVSEKHVEYSTGRPVGGLASFVARVAPTTLTLNSGQTAGVEVDIAPPAGAPLDSGVVVRLVATNNDDLLFPAVIDTIPPTVTPPSDITVDSTGALTVVAIGLATATDNVGVYSLTNNSDGLFPVGTTVVTWVALDAAGNMGTVTQNITVNDAVPDISPPVITPPPSVTAEATGPQTSVTLGTAAAMDDRSASANITITNNAPATFPVGATTVTWTATDEAGNSSTATQVVTVTDTTPPTVIAPIDVTTGSTGPTTSVNLGAATATDLVNGSLTASPDNPGPFAIGVHTVIWSATDTAGNTGTANQTVMILNSSVPVLTPPPAVTAEATGLQTSVALGTATATDDVTAPANILITNNAPITFALGATTVTWTATDEEGSSSTATQIVSVTDTTPPAVIAPPDVTSQATGSQTTVDIEQATATDVVGVVLLINDAVIESPPPSFPVGTTVVTWTAQDAAGNTGTATQTVIVLDAQAPVLTPPPAVTAEATGPQTSVALGTATATDDVTAPANILITNNAPITFALGATTVTWTAADEEGNSSTATQIVTVTDTTPPTVIAPIDVTTGSTGPTTSVNLGTATATDLVNGSLTASPDNPGPFAIGVHTVIWSATDTAGNTGTATQTVTVQSTLPESIVFDDNLNGTRGTQLDAHIPDIAGNGWSILIDPGQGISLSGNGVASARLKQKGTGLLYSAEPAPTQADVDVFFDMLVLDTSTDDSVILVFRYQDASNFYGLRVTAHTTSKMQLYKVVSGIATRLGTSANTPDATNTSLKIEVRGNALKVYEDPTQSGAWNLEIDVTDSSIPVAGKVGYGLGGVIKSSDDIMTDPVLDKIRVREFAP